MKAALAVAGIALSSSIALGGIISDGDMNQLPIGLAPDVTAGAGAWHFPSNYVSNHLGESLSTHYTVAGTATFDGAGPVGNSLRLKTGNEGASMHLVNLFGQTVAQGANVVVTAGFDIWVTDNASLTAGGSIILGGDHGGGGFSSITDRGPQITWGYQGKLTAKNAQGSDLTLLTGYQANRWQTVRLTIDLTTDRYDMFWGYKGGPLTMIGDDLPFRSGSLGKLDRFTWARFYDMTRETDAYLDNVFVNIPAPGAAGLLGAGALVALRRRR